MAKKTIKNTLLAAIITAVLCAGTVSARQLSLNAQTTTCSGFCSKKASCPNILGCACVKQPGFTTGTCQLIAAKPGK
jgi:hypothetical protein